MGKALKYESITIPLASADQIHMTRFYSDKNNLGAPVFLMHGFTQDSRCFYASDGSGLACFLAQQGYDVFVADLRGKGKSWPSVSGSFDFGVHHMINEDIPAILKKIVEKRGPVPQIWMGHGLGGVLLCSYYARYGNSFAPVTKMAHFGVSRYRKPLTAKIQSFRDRLNRYLSLALIAINGYFPAKTFLLGNCNESAGSYKDYIKWTHSTHWLDENDGFSYFQAVAKRHWPPSFYFSSVADYRFGNTENVRLFMKELGVHDARMMILSRRDGNLRDYTHLEMVGHVDGNNDHFPILLDWLKNT
jgi:predicted alpha/beta hydrolase